MKYLLIVIFLFSLYGCGGNSWDSYNYLYGKIHSWQDREVECLKEQRHLIFPVHEVSVSRLQELRRTIMSNFYYIPDDENDYWQTSCETQLIEEGDCEDFAILVLSRLRIQYPRYQAGVLIMTYTQDDKHEAHAVAIIYYSDDDFLILDRGWGVITGEDLRKNESLTDLRFKLIFNLEEIWFI